MKSLLVRSGLALLCATILAACGGGNGSGSMLLSGVILPVTPGSSVSSLTKNGLVLVNGTESISPLAGDTAFQFPNLIAVNDSFDIEIKTQPTGAFCTLVNNKNTANIYTVQQTQVSCTTNTWTLGGTVTGLKSNGLLLSNGSDVAAPTPSSSAPGAPVSFTFPVKVADGAKFGVYVLAQPASGNCTISTANNVGTMPAGDALGLTVNCI
ncbi:hypothetical protein [Rugamonas sp.]|uniref:hypothetical protein n=1 Tax=Rugamonas sp. TaxID=1926287 RepID=UPI0025D9BD87|nr:hypothetical protein [Rugamonas sp.]